jgi:hypothetical protein
MSAVTIRFMFVGFNYKSKEGNDAGHRGGYLTGRASRFMDSTFALMTSYGRNRQKQILGIAQIRKGALPKQRTCANLWINIY